MNEKHFKKGEVALERALSKLGFTSRSQAQKLIKGGQVRVGGKTMLNPFHRVHPETTHIEIDGQLQKASSKVIFLFHKPKHTLTTTHDPEGRKTVFDFFKKIPIKLHAVGRLDYATTGLLLLTNDTKLSDFLTNPRSDILRTYLVTVRGHVTPQILSIWLKGIEDKGETLYAKEARIQKASHRESHVVMKLNEGKNREIKRLCKATGHEVTRLRRVAFGDLNLGDLPPGTFREVPIKEMVEAFPNLPSTIVAKFKS